MKPMRRGGRGPARHRPWRFSIIAGPIALLAGLGMTLATSGADEHRGTPQKTLGVLVAFDNAPYPYDGVIPELNKPFFDTDAAGKYHLSPRGGKYREATYSDDRSLLYVPPAFDPTRPDAAIVLFFHGNLATLAYVRDHQGVPRQLAASGLDAVLVAPQLAVDALDSSPGHFYEAGFLAKYLDEAATHLAEQSGRPKSAFVDLPVIIVAYSGGYLAAAFSLYHRADTRRIKGVVLLDALFGEAEKFEDWIARANGDAFFLSAYSEASRGQNADLTRALLARGVRVRDTLPARIAPGDVIIQGPNRVPHIDFMTTAWTRDPLRAVLERVRLAGKPAHE